MFVAVLSDKPELRENFCKFIGKEISKDDIAVYSADGKIWLIDPLHYPEKIQPLLYSLSMADMVVLLVDSLSPKIGELLVAINAMKIAKGIIVSSVPLPVTGTVLEKYEKVADQNAAKEKVLAAKRAGVRDVILPAENKMNVDEDLTAEQLEHLNVHYVKTIPEVLELALPSTPREEKQDAEERERFMTAQSVT